MDTARTITNTNSSTLHMYIYSIEYLSTHLLLAVIIFFFDKNMMSSLFSHADETLTRIEISQHKHKYTHTHTLI